MFYSSNDNEPETATISDGISEHVVPRGQSTVINAPPTPFCSGTLGKNCSLETT